MDTGTHQLVLELETVYDTIRKGKKGKKGKRLFFACLFSVGTGVQHVGCRPLNLVKERNYQSIVQLKTSPQSSFCNHSLLELIVI